MHFQLRYVTPNFQYGAAKVSLVEPKSGMALSFSKRLPGDNGWPSFQPDDGSAVVTCQRDIPERHLQAAVESGKLSGKIQAVKAVYDEMHGFFLRTLRLLRWRTNPENKHARLYRFYGFYWSLDGTEWKSLLELTSIKILFSRQPVWNTQVEQFLIDGLAGPQDEPLAHELLREADALKVDNPRGSLVLGVTAAEVGFKQFVAKKLPETAWLLDLPTPPLEKMLDSFPWATLKLQINQKTVKFPEPLKQELKKAVLLRNRLVHTGAMQAKQTTIEEMLASVSDMLYFLDALSSETWAMAFVRPRTLKEFEKS
jgi:hypothetical protein